jgi:hypothetical protein
MPITLDHADAVGQPEAWVWPAAVGHRIGGRRACGGGHAPSLTRDAVGEEGDCVTASAGMKRGFLGGQVLQELQLIGSGRPGHAP